jgi:hypothetical protein
VRSDESGLVAERLDVLEVIEDIPPILDIIVRQMRQTRFVLDLAAGVDPKLALQLLANRFLQQLAAIGDDVAVFVAYFLPVPWVFI